jgi:hypothetical protein
MVNYSQLTRPQKERYYSDLWHKQFTYLTAMHFDTVIVQYAAYDSTLYFNGRVVLDGVRLAANPDDVGARALNIVMRQAEAAHIDVWVGLLQRRKWNDESWSDLVADPDPVVTETIAVAKALKSSGLLDSNRFAGWYISPEIDNFQPPNPQATAEAGNRMLRRLTSGLKRIANKPIAVSGYFRVSGINMGESEFFAFLCTTLAGSGIDVFLFQDGVGVEDSPQHPESSLAPTAIGALAERYAGVIAACNKARVQPWADVELFVGPNDRESAAPGRVLDQLMAAAPYPKRVVYDVDTDLTPLGKKPGAHALFSSMFEWLTGPR